MATAKQQDNEQVVTYFLATVPKMMWARANTIAACCAMPTALRGQNGCFLAGYQLVKTKVNIELSTNVPKKPPPPQQGRQ